jgi:hypothetical protein
VLAARRAEVDRLNTLCQELLAAHGRLGGDRVVCGHNAIGELGVANGSRGTITALDPEARTFTIRLDGSGDRMVTLPRSYLDGRGRGERNRRVDLAYATTGHRAQGLTRGRTWSGSPAPRMSIGCMCSCRGLARAPACMRWSAPNPRAPGNWTCPTATSPTATCSWPRRCLGLAGRPWP